MRWRMLGNALGICVVAAALAAGVVAQEKMKPEMYTGVAVGTGGTVGGKTVLFDIRITSYTTDDEVVKFAQIVKDQGTDGLRRALEKEDKGRISAVGTTGTAIAVARKRQVADGTILTIVTARYMPFVELYHSGRSVDYPFAFVQLKLNDKGEGGGQIMAAAKIRFNKKSEKYEIESFGNQYIKAVNVRTEK